MAEYTVQNVAKQPGIHDIYPLQARLWFAKAWITEAQAGETTPEAETLLNQAVQRIDEEQAKLLTGV